MTESITKKQAATAQLETAIKLFFENRDLISAYTLMAASDGILDGIWENEGPWIQQRRITDGKPVQFTFREEWGFRIKDEHKKLGWELLNATQNFFKHADRDHDQEHTFHSAEMTSVRLRTTIENYALIYDEITPAMNAYVSWHAVFYPDFLKKDSPLYRAVQANPYKAEAEKTTQAEKVIVGYDMLKKTCPELFQVSSMAAAMIG
jgi:hypothetical protein